MDYNDIQVMFEMYCIIWGSLCIVRDSVLLIFTNYWCDIYNLSPGLIILYFPEQGSTLYKNTSPHGH